MEPRDDVSVSLASEAGFSDDGISLSPWVFEVGAKQRLSVSRDRDVEGHPTYAVRCRVDDFTWTVSLLRFAKLQRFESRVAGSRVVPDPAVFPFPARLRRQAFGLRLNSDEVGTRAASLDAWFGEYSRLVRAACGPTGAAGADAEADDADAGPGDADAILGALASFVRLEEARAPLIASGALRREAPLPAARAPPPRRGRARYRPPAPAPAEDDAAAAAAAADRDDAAPAAADPAAPAELDDPDRPLEKMNDAIDGQLDAIAARLEALRASKTRRAPFPRRKSSRRSLSLRPRAPVDDGDAAAAAAAPAAATPRGRRDRVTAPANRSRSLTPRPVDGGGDASVDGFLRGVARDLEARRRPAAPRTEPTPAPPPPPPKNRAPAAPPLTLSATDTLLHLPAVGAAPAPEPDAEPKGDLAAMTTEELLAELARRAAAAAAPPPPPPPPSPAAPQCDTPRVTGDLDVDIEETPEPTRPYLDVDADEAPEPARLPRGRRGTEDDYESALDPASPANAADAPPAGGGSLTSIASSWFY